MLGGGQGGREGWDLQVFPWNWLENLPRTSGELWKRTVLGESEGVLPPSTASCSKIYSKKTVTNKYLFFPWCSEFRFPLFHLFLVIFARFVSDSLEFYRIPANAQEVSKVLGASYNLVQSQSFHCLWKPYLFEDQRLKKRMEKVYDNQSLRAAVDGNNRSPQKIFWL